MQEGILLVVVTGAMFWLCLWFATDRSKPSKYWWPFDMHVHGQEDKVAKAEQGDDVPDWRARRQNINAKNRARTLGQDRGKDQGRTWRRSGS